MGRPRKYNYETQRERTKAARRAWYARQKVHVLAPPRRYTAETKEQALEMVRNGRTLYSTSRILGCSPTAVSLWCRRNGILSRFRKHTPEPAPVAKPSGKNEETGRSRRAYLAKLLREALPGAIRAAREKMRRMEDM